jgi:phospholipid N-methyltransferase
VNSNLNFLKEYMNNSSDIGSITPDSATLVRALLEHAPLRSAGTILEYGPASGAVTREILKRMRAEATLVCVEKNVRFYRELAKHILGKNIFLINDDALRWMQYSAGYCGIRGGDVDCIISTLPCSSMDFKAFLRISILPPLREGGVFVQYMHTVSVLKGFRLRPMLEKHFLTIDSELVLSNLPPTMVYTCSGVL